MALAALVGKHGLAQAALDLLVLGEVALVIGIAHRRAPSGLPAGNLAAAGAIRCGAPPQARAWIVAIATAAGVWLVRRR